MSRKELDQKYVDVLKSHDWLVCDYTDDGRVELETHSPAGEDFCICVDVDNFPSAVAEYAADFDQDEHITMWVEAAFNGSPGIPNTRELVHDAKDIENMLQELASALREADELTDLSDCDEETKAVIITNDERLAEKDKTMDKGEFRQWIYDNYYLDGILDYAEGIDRRKRSEFFTTMFPSYHSSGKLLKGEE